MKISQNYITHVYVYNFKNYAQKKFRFSNQLNLISGKNGIGKTSVLDAIHFSAYGKSYFTTQDNFTIKHNSSEMGVTADFVNEHGAQQINIQIKRGRAKQIKWNGDRVKRLSEYVGQFPCVVIEPNDIQIVNEDSRRRRVFLDRTISQTDPNYLSHLVQYNRILKQRNALLKQYVKTKKIDHALLKTYTQAIIPVGEKIFELRNKFIDQFKETFQSVYNQFTPELEFTDMEYTSQLSKEAFGDYLERNLQKDLILGRTTVGIHKDDVQFKLHDGKLKDFGSQGQIKSFVVALKLAQFAYLLHINRKSPIIMLDDLHDKLDSTRVKAILEYLRDSINCQIFITDTERVRNETLIDALGIPYYSIHLDHYDEEE